MLGSGWERPGDIRHVWTGGGVNLNYTEPQHIALHGTRGRQICAMKLQHYLGGLEGLPEPLKLEKRVFVEDWEKRIFGIHVAMMGLSNHLASALPAVPDRRGADGLQGRVDVGRPAHRRRGDESLRLLQVSLLREVARRHHRSSSSTRATSPKRNSAARDAELVDRRHRVDAKLGDRRSGDRLSALGRQPAARRRAPEVRARLDRCASPTCPPPRTRRLPGYLRERDGTVERVFEGDYGYFGHTGDGIGDPMPIYIVEFAPAEIWGPRAEDGPQHRVRRAVRSLLGTHRGGS